jgi:RNA polymerase sigma factor (sigma-70 family)
MLHDPLAGLSPMEIRVLAHQFYDGLTQRDIADREGVSQSTVRRRLASGLEILRRNGAWPPSLARRRPSTPI